MDEKDNLTDIVEATDTSDDAPAETSSGDQQVEHDSGDIITLDN